MKCSVCKIKELGVILYRNNRKGIKADWRCEEHLDKKPDQITKEICELIINDNQACGTALGVE